MSENFIHIKGARVNNLKNIDVSIPRDKLVVVSGISGSGKSSLAFDTLFAEGQRRFVESLSSFARQFLGRMTKPDVDDITGIPPAIAIEQKVNTRNPRSTVGTTTEIYDYLRLLYARVGRTYSPVSGEEVKRHTVKDVTDYILSLEEGAAVYILVPLGLKSAEDGIEKLLAIKEQGFTRLFLDGELLRIDDLISDKATHGDFSLLIDRLVRNDDNDLVSRLHDSLNTAFSISSLYGHERGSVYISSGKRGDSFKAFSTLFEADGISFEEPAELLFSFNNPLGACPECSGYGKVLGIDEALVVPDTSLSIYQEAISCWRGETMSFFKDQLINNAHNFGFPVHKPYYQLTKEQKLLLWTGNEHFTGLNEFFKILDQNKYKIQYRIMKSRYTGKSICPSCSGARLRKEALYVKIGGRSISELLEMSIGEVKEFFDTLKLDSYESTVAGRALKELNDRLTYIDSVGLSYLTLNRPSNTLSGGESQRINLVSSLGSNLVGSLYVLDEPSIGLHPRDTAKLISVVEKLRNLGNTVLIVEHDEEIIEAADELIDIGPYAGRDGGELVYQGKATGEIPEESINKSLTLKYLYGKESISLPEKRRRWSSYVEIAGAYEHNLKDIDVKFPLRVFTAVTGVSGSGKSTLVRDILYPALYRRINQLGEKPGAHRELRGDLEKITSVEYVDQNPIGKSTRSNPATYLKIYDEIRKLYSEQPYAKSNGFGHSHFSFNIDGGRCPECQGEGVIKIEMQFMADVQMVCDSCKGKRFKDEILEVKYKGHNINDILNMSVDEAWEFFSVQKESISRRIAEKLQPLKDVGLSYVRLGQSSSTLSGGESQRVKLASFLGKDSSQGSIMFIFDEPTTGLHFHDIKKLMNSFTELISRGHTIVVVEHNMDVVKCADWIIDMGPEAGDLGGYAVFEGTPEELVKNQDNYTAKALLKKLSER